MIEEVNLSYNDLSVCVCREVAAALRGKQHLTKLDITGNLFGKKGLKLLTKEFAEYVFSFAVFFLCFFSFAFFSLCSLFFTLPFFLCFFFLYVLVCVCVCGCLPPSHVRCHMQEAGGHGGERRDCGRG